MQVGGDSGPLKAAGVCVCFLRREKNLLMACAHMLIRCYIFTHMESICRNKSPHVSVKFDLFLTGFCYNVKTRGPVSEPIL